jgi:Xaa-Pro dipeptidase
MITRDVALRRVSDALSQHSLDALVAVSPWNVAYTAGTSFFTQRTIPERLAIVVLTAKAEPAFIYCSIEDEHAREEGWVSDLRGYTEFQDKPMLLLAESLEEKGLSNGRIGIEMRFLVAKNYEELRSALPNVELVEADPIFDRMRASKSAEEVAFLERITYWTDQAIQTAFSACEVGDTERSIGDRMIVEANGNGATGLLHLVLATGPNLLKAHAAPGATRVEPRGMIRTDFGMYWGTYVSDVARTALVHPVSEQSNSTYRQLEQVHQKVIGAIRPGMPASEVYQRYKSGFAAAGLNFKMPHVGHSIGLTVHEYPMMHPFDQTPLEPGMVIMLEPGIIGDEGMYHTEDMILITEDGCRILGRSRDWGEPLIVGRDR